MLQVSGANAELGAVVEKHLPWQLTNRQLPFGFCRLVLISSQIFLF